jgi:hypothetical protein
LDHGQFEKLEYQNYFCRFTYAVDKGYGFHSGPFRGNIQIFKEAGSTERLWKLEINWSY